MADRLLLVDGNSVLYRAFYGVPLLTNSQGMYTNAVYGFAQMLLNVLKEEKPTHIAVAFDKGKTTFRHAEFPEYKGKRSATPPELKGQFAMARELLTHLRIPYLELENFEADDIIGTLAKEGQPDVMDVVVISGDKDLLQLVSPQVTACLTRKGTTDLVRYTPAAVQERFGLTPLQIIDLKGLMGDSSDNIPGVPGVGEKTAVKLLAEWGTVEEVLEHIDDVQGAKLKERLREHRELALLSKRLATIHRDVPLSVDLASLRYEGFDPEEVKTAFRQLEFRSLVDRIPSWGSSAPTAAAGDEAIAEEASAQGDSLALVEVALADLPDVLDKLTGPFSVLPDLMGRYQIDTLHGVAIAASDLVLYVPMAEDVSAEEVAPLVDFLLDPKRDVITYDSKALIVRMANSGWIEDVYMACPGLFDAILATYLIHASEGEPELLDVIGHALPHVSVAEAVREGITKGGQHRRMALGTCAQWLRDAHPVLQTLLSERELTDLYTTVELPLSRVLAEMETYGVRIDTQRLEEIGKELLAGIARLTAQIYQLAGTTFNINSTKQLGEILFDKMGLPAVKKTKTGYSTSADVLEKLAPQSEIVSSILEYRTLSKLQSTYIEGLLREVRGTGSRIHTAFHQAKAMTGRLSSEDPNLQNIPIRMEEGRRLRQAFIPTHDGWYMLSADYSQVELRIMAHLSQDVAMLEAFRTGVDIHTRTASEVFDVAIDAVTSAMRRQAKAVNFGIIYGISDYGLSQNLNISRAQAGAFIEQYFAKFPGVKAYLDASVARAKELGYAETVLGRKRYLPGIHSRNFNERSFAERTAMNTPIQGTAADIIKVAMISLSRSLRDSALQARLLLQVHDELICECPEAEIAALSDLVTQAMESAVELSVPLQVDVHYGRTWYDAK